jgi:hypothetical protein
MPGFQKKAAQVPISLIPNACARAETGSATVNDMTARYRI